MKVPKYVNRPSLLFGFHWLSLLLSFLFFIVFVVFAYLAVGFGLVVSFVIFILGLFVAGFFLLYTDPKLKTYGGKFYIEIILYRLGFRRGKYGSPEGLGL